MQLCWRQGEGAKSFSSCRAGVLGVCCRYSSGNNRSPTQGNAGAGRLNFRDCMSSFVDAWSVGEYLEPWMSVRCFHTGCGAFTSLALKVKGIESLQDVPGRDFCLCQQRAAEQASFSLFWPQFLPWQSRALVIQCPAQSCVS